MNWIDKVVGHTDRLDTVHFRYIKYGFELSSQIGRHDTLFHGMSFQRFQTSGPLPQRSAI